ncbi:hypothetical protein ACJX0J_009696 [Zea mays]
MQELKGHSIPRRLDVVKYDDQDACFVGQDTIKCSSGTIRARKNYENTLKPLIFRFGDFYHSDGSTVRGYCLNHG